LRMQRREFVGNLAAINAIQRTIIVVQGMNIALN
jgi:hypothetical protein